ncbi:MAG TPA: flavodoxin family protein [Patescibacteria group bacterium]|nr:flavodoxin family protein [Patescibacteria group bacterium]
MKVIAFNGSPRKNSNTEQNLARVGAELQQAGIDFEIIQVGNKTIRGCLACGKCVKSQNEQCTITTDEVNEWIQKMKQADGILLGSPVHYAGVAGTMKSFLDRAFFVCGVNGNLLRHKVGAAVVSVRRSGGISAFDGLNHYINYAEMFQPASNYWNVIHGMAPGEASQDEEGQQILQVLGKNMAWLLQVIAAGRDKVAPVPAEPKIFTNFIR